MSIFNSNVERKRSRIDSDERYALMSTLVSGWIFGSLLITLITYSEPFWYRTTIAIVYGFFAWSLCSFLWKRFTKADR